MVVSGPILSFIISVICASVSPENINISIGKFIALPSIEINVSIGSDINLRRLPKLRPSINVGRPSLVINALSISQQLPNLLLVSQFDLLPTAPSHHLLLTYKYRGESSWNLYRVSG